MSEKKIIFGEDVDPEPDDLPQVTAKQERQDGVTAARTCEKCKSISVRINSTAEGRRAWCNQCGHNWGISLATSTHIPDGLYSRGLSRRTVVEPDWNLAFEDLEDWEESDK